ncbi:MAG: DUF3857 domain-containing protein [Bacteroidales bacterium]
MQPLAYLKKFFLNVIILSQAVCSLAQVYDDRPGQEILKMISSAPDDKGSETGALILLKDVRLTVGEKNLKRLEIHLVGKVYKREAVADYAQIPLRYNSFYEEPVLNFARVIYKDGTIKDVRKDGIQIKNLPEMEGLQFTDTRYLSFALTGLEPGTAFEYKVTITDKMPVIENEWSYTQLFSFYLRMLAPPYKPRTDPCLKSVFTLVIPSSRQFNWKSSLPLSDPEMKSLGKTTEYTWTVTDLPAIQMEYGMPPISRITPVIYMTSLKDWEQVDRWAAKKFLKKIRVNNEIASRVQNLVAGKRNDLEKVASIFNYIRKSINYLYTDLERGGYEPHYADEVFRSKYGDCKDQTILLISMLEAANIKAWPALINPFPQDEFPDLPNIDFSHLITYLELDGKPLFLDPTAPYCPFPELTGPDQDRKVFIINGEGGKLLKTPEAKPENNLANFNMEIMFRKGTAVVNFKIDAKGTINEFLKQTFSNTANVSVEDFFKWISRSVSETAVFDTLILSDLSDPQVPFSAHLIFHIDSIWNAEQGAVGLGSHTELFLSLLMNIDTKNYPNKRYNDIVIKYPQIITGREKFILPARDLMCITMPPKDSVVNKWFNFRQGFSHNPTYFTANFSLLLNGNNVDREEYSSYLQSLRTLRQVSGWNVQFIDPLVYISALTEQENPAHTIAECDKMLAEDPNNVYALMASAMAYYKNSQINEAIKRLKEVLGKEPDNKYAHYFLAKCYTAINNRAVARMNLTSALLTDPEFDAARALKATLYFADKNIKDALDEIEEGLRKNPSSIPCLRTKVFILMLSGKSDEAMNDINLLVAADSSNADLLGSLADLMLDADKINEAISLYSQAIKADNRNPKWYGNLGWAYYLNDDVQKCLEFSTKAVSMNPDLWYAHYNIALSLLRSGNIKEAREKYARLKFRFNEIPLSVRQGAIKDLKELVKKGIYVKEAKEIISDFF